MKCLLAVALRGDWFSTVIAKWLTSFVWLGCNNSPFNYFGAMANLPVSRRGRLDAAWWGHFKGRKRGVWGAHLQLCALAEAKSFQSLFDWLWPRLYSARTYQRQCLRALRHLSLKLWPLPGWRLWEAAVLANWPSLLLVVHGEEKGTLGKMSGNVSSPLGQINLRSSPVWSRSHGAKCHLLSGGKHNQISIRGFYFAASFMKGITTQVTKGKHYSPARLCDVMNSSIFPALKWIHLSWK